MSQHEVVLLLGSNLGNTRENIEIAKNHIKNNIGQILTESEFLHSEAVEFASNNIFCNIALLIKTQFSPVKLLKSIKLIEAEMGRTADSRTTGAYADRIIDIDIVQYGNLYFYCKKLEIPHRKHLYEREFSGKLLKSLSQKPHI